MKLKNGDEYTTAGRVTLVGGALLGLALVLGVVVALAPPSEIEAGREARKAAVAEKARDNEVRLARELNRRLNN
jgi:hypothetical protein